MDEKWINQMPKIDLHCHLDGSLPINTIRKLARNAGILLPHDAELLLKQITVPPNCPSLKVYLERFALAVSCLQTTENLYQAAYDLIEEVSKEHVVYIEVRFAPMLSVYDALSAEDVVRSVIQGLSAGKRDFGVESGVILCAMRNHSAEKNNSLLPIAIKYLGRGVVALDLAGDEKAYPVQEHRAFFDKARVAGIPYTIHAGEAAGAESVKAALLLGARRIGHGIALKDDFALMEACTEKRIGIEMCPTSNLQTKAVADWGEYPFLLFMKNNLAVTINTDNRTVSGTSLTREFASLQETFSVTQKTAAVLYANAVEASFADISQKEMMKQAFDRFIQKYEIGET